MEAGDIQMTPPTETITPPAVVTAEAIPPLAETVDPLPEDTEAGEQPAEPTAGGEQAEQPHPFLEDEMPLEVQHLYQEQVAGCAADVIQALGTVSSDQLQQIDKGGNLSSLAILYPTYQHAMQTNNETACRFLSGLMYRHLQLLPPSTPALWHNEDVSKKLRALPIAGEYCARQRGELLNLVFTGAEMDPKEMPDMDTDRLLDDLIMAHWCESQGGLVKDETTGDIILSPRAQDMVNTWAATGKYQAGETELIIKLAKKRLAYKVLGMGLGIDIEQIRNKNAASLYATGAAEGIDRRRTAQNSEPLTVEAKQALAKSLEAHLRGKSLAFDDEVFQQGKLAHLSNFGMIALMSLPAFQSFVDDETAERR